MATLARGVGLVVALICLGPTAAGADASLVEHAGGRAMGTSWSAKWVRGNGGEPRAAIEQRLAARLEELERALSTYRTESELSRFNVASAGEWIAVSPDVVQVAVLSRELARVTGGAFDAGVGGLVTRWGFGPDGVPAALPTEREIEARRRWVGSATWEVRAEPPALRKSHATVALDFSSVGKGYAVDALRRVLREAGLDHFLVQIAGDMWAQAGGSAPRPWRVAVEQPGAPGEHAARLLLADRALSTSGNYRNVIERDGKRFGHVIDPRTGRPVDSPLLAVSVVHGSGAESSGWATGLLVLGADEGLRLAEAQGIAALFQLRTAGGVEQRRTSKWREIPQ